MSNSNQPVNTGGRRASTPQEELRNFARSLYLVLTLSLSDTKSLSGDATPSPVSQARQAVLTARSKGAVRAVVHPGYGAAMAYEGKDGKIHCMEASFANDHTKSAEKTDELVKAFQKSLDSRLLDDEGWIKGDADMLHAFKCAVVAVDAVLILGKPLSEGSVEAAVASRGPKVKSWECEKPKAARALKN